MIHFIQKEAASNRDISRHILLTVQLSKWQWLQLLSESLCCSKCSSCQVSNKCDIDFITKLSLICCQVFSFHMATSRAIRFEVVFAIFSPCQICRIWIAINIIDRCTIVECVNIYVCHTIAYRHDCKATATEERLRSDACHVVANCNACKTIAILKRLIPDTRNTITNRHDSDTVAIMERLIPDTRNAVGYYHTC